MPWRLPWVTVRIFQSTAMEKSTGDMMHLCLTPEFTLKGSVTWLFCMTRHSEFSYKAWMMFTNFCCIQWCRRIFKSDGRCRQSKAFSMSTKTMNKELFRSCDCSRIWRRTKMWLMHDPPLLKPACSRCSSLPTVVVMHWRMMRHYTVLATDSSVIPLQLLHSDRFPFMGV